MNLASTRPEIAFAVLDAVEAEHGGFWKFCEQEMGLTHTDLELIVRSVQK